MNVIFCSERLPPERRHVLIRYTGDNWKDDRDPEGQLWRVGYRVAGKVEGNNRLPYRWCISGHYWFGQTFDRWCELPRGEE